LWQERCPETDSALLRSKSVSRLEQAIHRWDLKDLSVIPTGNVSLAVFAQSEQRRVVVKIVPEYSPLTNERLVLDNWKDLKSSVNLIDSSSDRYSLLLERVDPGATLKESNLTYIEKLKVVGQQSKQLRKSSERLPHISETDLATSWYKLLKDNAHDQYTDLLERLLIPGDKDCLIHADLHQENILCSREGWQTIDPHG
jgi:streptomycin 6-kinase